MEVFPNKSFLFTFFPPPPCLYFKCEDKDREQKLFKSTWIQTDLFALVANLENQLFICKQEGTFSWISWWDTTKTTLAHQHVSRHCCAMHGSPSWAPARQLSTTGNFATWPSVQLDTRNRQMHTSKKLLYNMSSRGIAEERNEGTSTSPHLYFGRGQSSKWLQGKTTSVARLFSACTAMRSFWCQAHTLTDDGKSRCGEKLSGFYRTSERHFKGKGNVQVIKKPISLMCFKTAIIHLMPKRRKKKKGIKEQ